MTDNQSIAQPGGTGIFSLPSLRDGVGSVIIVIRRGEEEELMAKISHETAAKFVQMLREDITEARRYEKKHLELLQKEQK